MTSLDPLLIPEVEQERASALPVAQAGARYPLKAQLHARDVHRRLRNPANAVADIGIDLRRHRKPAWVTPRIEQLAREQVPQTLRYLVWPLQEIILRPIDFDGRITVRHIVNIVCQDFGIRDEKILAKNRSAHYVLPRHICVYLSKMLTDQTWTELARRFERDHSALIYAFRKIEGLRITLEGFAADLDRLAAKVTS